ncbi:serine hydrolase domain-containing protein [Haloferax sp. DFSO52]|uniref:serine hydrolase domain-containing protein n=1 Tax=Haloferax sp. DFSO52 TaxID=3388505 RepID=UPI003A839830
MASKSPADTTREQTRPERKTSETDRKTIQEIHSYFDDPTHAPELQFANDRTFYAWQHMSEFKETEQILRAGPISELPERIDPDIGNIVFSVDGTQETVGEQFDSGVMDALLVIHGGDIVFEKYKTMRPFDKHNWFSCGKTIAGMMVALLEHDGEVDVKKSVSDYVPELKDSAWDDVTVEETMDMATGLDSTEHEVPDARTNPERGWYKWAVSIGLFYDEQGTNQSPYDVLRSMKRDKPAYTAFEYNSINTFVLERIVNNVTGKSVAEVFGDRVWRKAGMENDGYIGLTRNGLNMSWGFTSSGLRDLGRWGTLFTPSWGNISRERIIPQSVIEKIQTGGRPEIYLEGAIGQQFQEGFPDVTGLTNRYQWDVVFPDGDFYKSGVGAQGLYVSPSTDAVVAWFSTGSQDDEPITAALARAIVQQLRSE